MAWTALQRLVAMGEAGEAEIDAAEIEDDTSTGYLAAIQARAMIPIPENKTATWELITSGEPTNLELRHLVMGFRDVHDVSLLRPYTDQYFDTVDGLWGTSSFEMAETFAVGLFPVGDLRADRTTNTRHRHYNTHPSGAHDRIARRRSRALTARAAF